jgi:ABC-2 type transport system ATP-binding protein
MTPEQTLALEIVNISKAFKKEDQRPRRSWPWRPKQTPAEDREILALNRINLQVRKREIYGILGPNGSGKSTLIRLISTLILTDTGKITIFGHDVEHEELAVKRLINRVSVEAAFFKKLSPMENLLFGARLYGLEARVIRPKVYEILERLGLRKDAITSPMEHMSRGMQQKVAIARAFLTAPVLLLLDEPTTGLDPRSKREVQQFVLELREQHDATVVLTTHDMGEAEALCDRIAIIDNGRIVAEGTPAELKNRVVQRNGHEPTLEDVFMELTGRTMGEAEEQAEEGLLAVA